MRPTTIFYQAKLAIQFAACLGLFSLFGVVAYSQSLTASPNPIYIDSGTTTGQFTIYAIGPCCNMLGVYVNGPNGPLFTQGISNISATTGNWVTNGMTFYFVDEVTHVTLATLTAHTLGVQQLPLATGCSFGPYTSCLDPVPATYTGGSWIEDDSASEWTLTAYNGSPGSAGTVSGQVYVFSNPNPGCPVPVYTAGGIYTPSDIVNGRGGSTSFNWTATNPNPGTTCGGYTPVMTQHFDGTIANKGNDTASGMYSNSIGGKGPITLETNLVFTPTSETLSNDGYGPSGSMAYTLLFFGQTLQDSHSYDGPDPNQTRFQGRQVYETAGTTAPSDACYQSALNIGKTPPVPRFAVQGSVWNVGPSGFGNHYGEDGVGFNTASINWYRANLVPGQLPCTATTSQVMMIVTNIPGFGDQTFATHTLSVTIDTNSTTVSKDGLGQTQSY